MKIENLSLSMLEAAINAQFAYAKDKLPFLEKIRTDAEVEKHLARVAWDMHILPEKEYITLAEMLVTISKMTNGWIGYINGGR